MIITRELVELDGFSFRFVLVLLLVLVQKSHYSQSKAILVNY